MIPEKKSYVVANRVELESLNTRYHEFLKRLETHGKKSLFAAGLFFDRDSNALLVKDDQDGRGTKVWNKIPGGVSEKIFSLTEYLEALKAELKKMKYGKSMIDQIIKREEEEDSEGKRNLADRTMLLELVEETAYFPTSFSYAMDGYRYNWYSKKHDLLQVHYSINSLISPYSKNIDDGIKYIKKVRTAEAIDLDIQDMRVIVPVEKLINTIGPETHKLAAKIICDKKAVYFNKKLSENNPVSLNEYFKSMLQKFAFASK